jgi:thiamine pyrophosphokinase
MRAVVVAGGDIDPADAALLHGADLVVAADGGTASLERLGVRPHLVVGDLDSADPATVARLEATGTRVERHPVDKGASDAELAIERALGEGPDGVVVLGLLGGLRLDHELAALLLLADPSLRGRDVRAVRGGTTVRALHGDGRLQLVGRPGDIVTLLPVAGDAIGVRTMGLRWALDGETLRLGRSRGLSNEVTEAPASVGIAAGVLLVVEIEQGGGHR